MSSARVAETGTDDLLRGDVRPDLTEICRRTLAFCEEKGVLPVPPIYELVFAYLEGSREDIVAELDRAIASGQTKSFHLLEIHDRLLGHDELTQAFDQIGTDLGNEIGSLVRLASSGQEGAARSRNELSRLFSGMRTAPNRSEMSSVAQRMRDIVLQQSRNVSEMKEGLDDARARLHRIEKELEGYVHAANTDFLTGLPNRRALDAKLAGIFARPALDDRHESLLMIDIDWFKQVNDTHGHDVGDNVLREFSTILRAACEKTGAYAGRWGGEEFCVIHSGGDADDGFELAESIRIRFEGLNWKRMSDGGDIGKITVSVGLAMRDADSDAESIVRDADRALYAAKEEGRNRSRRFGDL